MTGPVFVPLVGWSGTPDGCEAILRELLVRGVVPNRPGLSVTVTDREPLDLWDTDRGTAAWTIEWGRAVYVPVLDRVRRGELRVVAVEDKHDHGLDMEGLAAAVHTALEEQPKDAYAHLRINAHAVAYQGWLE